VVLVADGEERVLQQVSPTLEKAGFTVLTTLGWSATLEFCRDYGEPVQLAIIDIEMGTGSQELLRELYQTHPGVRVLFTSTGDPPGQVGLSAHFSGFLKKPFRRSRLLGSVLKAIDAPLPHTA